LPTKAKVHIQHIIKKFRSLEKQLRKIHTGQDIKDASKEQEFLYKKHNTKCVFTKKERCAWILQNLTISLVIRRREMNINLVSHKVAQVFNSRFCILDGL
jgi:hypothetical protein